jgi:hypothetical protein
MPPHALLQIPELLYLIFESLRGGNDVIRLASASRRLFDLLMPLAWEHVSGASQLFALIPRTTITRRIMGVHTSERIVSKVDRPTQISLSEHLPLPATSRVDRQTRPSPLPPLRVICTKYRGLQAP